MFGLKKKNCVWLKGFDFYREMEKDVEENIIMVMFRRKRERERENPIDYCVFHGFFITTSTITTFLLFFYEKTPIPICLFSEKRKGGLHFQLICMWCWTQVGEVGELSEIFQWKGEVPKGLPDWKDEEKEHLGEELSDVLLYLVRLSDICGVDLGKAALRKVELNAIKYPVNQCKGSSRKYNHLIKNNGSESI